MPSNWSRALVTLRSRCYLQLVTLSSPHALTASLAFPRGPQNQLGALTLQEHPVAFAALLSRVAAGECAEMDEIEKDLHRTCPGHAAFGAGGAGREKLRQVLATYSLRNPAVGYCQALRHVAHAPWTWPRHAPS